MELPCWPWVAYLQISSDGREIDHSLVKQPYPVFSSAWLAECNPDLYWAVLKEQRVRVPVLPLALIDKCVTSGCHFPECETGGEIAVLTPPRLH